MEKNMLEGLKTEKSLEKGSWNGLKKRKNMMANGKMDSCMGMLSLHILMKKKVDSKLGQAYGQKAKGSNGFIQKNLQIQ